MTAISIFERFLTNNIHFYNTTDMIIYINNIIEELYKSEEYYDIVFEKDKTVEDIMNYFYNHVYTKETISKRKVSWKEDNIVYRYLLTLEQNQLNKIYYKNNLMKFFDDAYIRSDNIKEKFIDGFKEIFKGVFLNPNKPSETQEEILDSLWLIINDWIFYNYQDYHKYYECKNGIRNTVLTVDTDSNFLYLGVFYLYFRNNFSDLIDDSKEKKVTSVNIITYFLTNVINQTYLKLTEESNIPETHRPLINMKNEFMLARILLTKNKKNYASSVLMKEGELFNNSKIDIKGLAIKKTSTNKNVRNYFQKMLDEDIINSDTINYSTIIGKFFKFSDKIKDSIKSGSTEFSLPGNANDITSYKDPYSIQSVRGIILWNTLFPDEEITLPNKVNMFKINIENNINDFEQRVKDYYEENNLELDEEDFNEFLLKMEEAMNNEKLYKKGYITIISFPKTLKKFPTYLIPFIEVNTIVADQLNSATILLDCLDIQTIKINNKLVPTNIIKI